MLIRPVFFPTLASGSSISLFPPLEGFTSKLCEQNLEHLLMEWLTFKILKEGTIVEVKKNVGHKSTLL